MRLYKAVDPRIKIYQTRFPSGYPRLPSGKVPAEVQPVLELVDWWVPHSCQWVTPGVQEALADLRASRRQQDPSRPLPGPRVLSPPTRAGRW